MIVKIMVDLVESSRGAAEAGCGGEVEVGEEVEVEIGGEVVDGACSRLKLAQVSGFELGEQKKKQG